MYGPPPPDGTPREVFNSVAYGHFSTATPSPYPSPRPSFEYQPRNSPSSRDYDYPKTRTHFRKASNSVNYSCPPFSTLSPRYTSHGYYNTANVTEDQRLPRPRSNPRRYSPSRNEHRKSSVEYDEDRTIEIDGMTYAIPARHPRNHCYNTSDRSRWHYYEEPGTDPHSYEQGGYDHHHGSLKSSPRRARPTTTSRPIASRSSSHRSLTGNVRPNPAVVKATEADAKKFDIPAGYSLKNWDPEEEPIMLLGSVFDANSLGKWIYDWTVYHHGPAKSISDTAGELWLLLIQLTGKLNRSEGCVPKIRIPGPQGIIEDFLESGEQLAEKLRKLLEKCGAPLRCLLRNRWRVGLASLAVLGAGVPMTAAALEWEGRVGPLLGIAANAAAGSSAVAIVPLRTMANIDQAYWIAAYSVWAVAFSVIFLVELSHHRPGLRRKLFVSLAFILSLHLFGFVSSENASVIDGLTIFGPLVVTISVYLMSVLFEANLNIFTAVLDA